MTTDVEILQDVYNLVAESGLPSRVSGGVYKGMRPADSRKEDVVINVLTSAIGDIREAVVNVNVFVADRAVNHGKRLRRETDYPRVRTLSRHAADALSSVHKHGIWLKMSEQHVYDVKDTGEHMISNRLLYRCYDYELTYEIRKIMAELSWGKPRLFASKLEPNGQPKTWFEFATPVEGSTTLETSEGDKKEAKIEGGENEAVKYNKSTYTLEFEVREALGRDQPLANADGVIDGEYALWIQPEVTTAKGIKFDRGVFSVQTQFGSEDGIVYHYKFDALKPETGNTAKVEVITVPSVSPSVDVGG